MPYLVLITRIGKGYAQTGVWFQDRRIGASDRRAVVCHYQASNLTKSRRANEDRRMDAIARRLTGKAPNRQQDARSAVGRTFDRPAVQTRHAGANAVYRSRVTES